MKLLYLTLVIFTIFTISCNNTSNYKDEEETEDYILTTIIKSFDCSPDYIAFTDNTLDHNFTASVIIKETTKEINKITLSFSSPSNFDSEYFGNSIVFDLTYNNSTTNLYDGIGTIKYIYESGVWKIKACTVYYKDDSKLLFYVNTNKSLDHYMYHDNSANKTNLSNVSIAAPLTVSDTDYDGDPPEIISISVTPTTVNGDTTLDITIEAKDDGSGLYNEIDLIIGSPDYMSNGYGQHIMKWWLPYTPYNLASGKFEGTASISQYHESGIWKVCYIKLVDNRFNTGYYKIKSDISGEYYALKINGSPNYKISNAPIHEGITVNNSNYDNICPEVTSIYITPDSIPSSGGTITIKIGVDNFGGSGIKYVNVNFSDSDNKNSKEKNLTYNSLSGLYEGTLDFEVNDENGTWLLEDIDIEDNASNYTELEYGANISTSKYFKYYYDNLNDITITNFDILSFVKN